ncbi:MAG: RtcB family protein [Thermoplasmata archaeon]|jgi:tRNA-splicing ligase RtcB|nr:RtcB family protein [Thermoplasmata archaeon]
MAYEGQLRRIDDNRWEIPKDESKGMRTNAVIFASEAMLSQIRADNAPMQAANVACIPGIVGSSMAMPDIHWGYGFPIGGVAAVDADSGCISPGGIGFDINCGVRLIKTDLTLDDIGGLKQALVDELYKNVPSGLGSKGLTQVGYKELDDILANGSEWAVENGYGWERDLEVTEERGHMMDADISAVSDKARKRGLPQLGSLGSGNHFLELDLVENVFDEATAKAYGLKEGTITITVHCGSRGCGHQIATDYLQEMERYIRTNSIPLPDRQLACAPLDSDLGDRYYRAMCCGANYAWANRQMITHWCRESFEKVLGDSAESMGMDVVYDVAHNIAKKERHDIDRHYEDVLVHRKGATRAFAPGRSEIAMKYRDFGQPVIIPGDMSVGTYVLAGRRGSMEQTFGSSCHGAGRQMSRKAAIGSLSADQVKREMAEKDIYLRNGSEEGVCEEAPQAYKDVDEVIRVVCDAGLTAKVAKLTPIGVIKGRGPSWRPWRRPRACPWATPPSRTSRRCPWTAAISLSGRSWSAA